MHSPSEHTVNGKHYDVELHIVHHYKGTDDQLGAVIAIFFDVGVSSPSYRNNDLLDSIFKIVDNVDDNYSGTVRLQQFLQNVDFSSYWNYNGSQTTPPCQEGMKWTVIKDVQEIS